MSEHLPPIHVMSAVAGPYGNNTYFLVANCDEPGGTRPCLIVDAPPGAAELVDQVVQEHQLRPVVLLLTHGHLDHTRDAGAVATKYRIPTYIHSADAFMAREPKLAISPEGAQILGIEHWRDLPELKELESGSVTFPGFPAEFTVAHAPGHSPGSMVVTLDNLAIVGDVLFQGSIGRTDLPASDPAAMARTLREIILPLPDAMHVLPGHGPTTTIQRERATNPFLLELQ